MIDIHKSVKKMAEDALDASHRLSRVSTNAKNAALLRMADEIGWHRDFILSENKRDLTSAKEKGLSAPMIDRLTIKDDSLKVMMQGLREIAALPDPVGKVTSMWRRPNGLLVGRMRIPLGVIGIIYESRPNVTVDASALCIKSGNAVILRGGSESIHSNLAIASILQDVLRESPLPDKAIQVIPFTDREAVTTLLQLDEQIDLIIPRGGEELIRAVVAQSKIPVIKHYKGMSYFCGCHCGHQHGHKHLHQCQSSASGVCNAMETLLVHADIAPLFYRKSRKNSRKPAF